MNVVKSIKKLVPGSIKIRIIELKKLIYRTLRGLKRINTDFELSSIGRKGIDTFFGYYDVSPFNSVGQLIYLEKVRNSLEADVIVNTINNDSRRVIARTHAVNMQQGARLRWFPGSTTKVMFNDFIDDKFICRVIDIDTNEEQIFKNPIYDISSDGKYYASLDFERLGVMRPGYGYTNRKYIQPTDLSKESLKIFDVATDTLVANVTYAMIAKAMEKKVIDFSKYYLNHLSFSPDGTKILFFWIEKIGNWDQANLLTYNLLTEDLYVHEKEYKVSHYTWCDNETILCTAIKGDSVHSMQCRYFLYKEGQPRRVIGQNVLLCDGHPTYYDTDIILSDTYPDLSGMQELFMFNIRTGIKKRLVYSNSVKSLTAEARTDMHPRFNEDKTIICYDSNVSGNRNLYLLRNWK